MASTDAKPFPIKNTAYRVYFPILDADGDLVTGATGLDSERSLDGATFADCTNEATEVATSSGIYYLDLTSSEMNTDCTVVIVKTTSSGAKTTPITLYPVETGDIDVDVTAWLGTAAATPTVAGVPEVDVTHWIGTAAATPTTAGVPEVDVTYISGDLTAADNLELFMDGTGYAGGTTKLGVNTTQWSGTNVATPTVAGVPEVDLTHVAGATTNVSALATNVDAILTDTGTTLDAKINTIDTVVDAILVDTGTTLDAALAVVDANVDAILVDTGTTLDGKIDTLDTNVDAILADTGTDGVVVATGSKTGYALSTAGIDAILQRALVESYAADGAAPTLTQALLAVHQALFDHGIVGVDWTIYGLDGTTPAIELTLNDATDPDAVSRTG